MVVLLKTGCIRAKVVIFRKSSCNRAKQVVPVQGCCILGKVNEFGQSVVFGKGGSNRAKWLYLNKSG